MEIVKKGLGDISVADVEFAKSTGGKRANVRVYGFGVGISRHVPKSMSPLVEKYTHRFDIFYELLDHVQEWAVPKKSSRKEFNDREMET